MRTRSHRGTRRMESSPKDGDDDCCGCCGHCNPQVFTSTLLGALACVLVTGGVFLAFHKWDLMWLIVSGVGIVLIVIGAGLHYCGNKNAESQRKRKPSKPRPSNEQSLHEQLLPSAPTLGNSCSISQLSLNMLPPYFPAYGSVSSQQNAQPMGTHSISQIMQINGQSFLVLPISGDGSAADTQSLAARLSMVFPTDQPSEPIHEEISENAAAAATDAGSLAQCTGDSGCQTDSTIVSQISTPICSPPVVVSNLYQASELIPSKKDAELQTSCPGTPQVHSLHIQVKDNHENTASTSGKVPQVTPAVLPISSLLTLHDTSQTEHSSNSENALPNLISLTQENEQAQVCTSPETLAENFSQITSSDRDSEQHTERVPSQEHCTQDDSAVISAVEEHSITDNAAVCDAQPSVSSCEVTEESQRDLIIISVPEPLAPSLTAEENVIEHAETSSASDQHICGGASSPAGAEAGPSQGESSCQLTLLDIPDNCSETPLPSDQEDELDICGRSSPPPSYDEVTQEIQQSIGAFGLAYGTI